MNIVQTPIQDIRPYDKNAKKHPPKQLRQIAESIKAFGFNQPVVTDNNRVIIVGHGRYFAAQKLGMTEIPVLTIELDEEKARSYRLADNKLNESDWEMELVIEELKNMSFENLKLTGFDSDLIIDNEPKDDDVPDVPEIAQSKLGDIYKIGEHRLMCGLSTERSNVEKLMDGHKAQMCFTDPPYNVDYTGGASGDWNKEKKREVILNDKMSDEQFFKFLSDVCANIIEFTKGGVYICMSSSELGNLTKAFKHKGGHWQSYIIWVKNNFTLSRADYQHTYEPILYGWSKEITNHFFTDDRGKANVWEDLRKVKTSYKDGYTLIEFQGFKVRLKGEIKEGSVIRKRQRTDIWRHDKPTKSQKHPTMKPVALCTEAIINSSEHGQTVLDLFGGSGSTLIAAEKTQRKCFMMELDPKYVDVIVTRYLEYTGNTTVIKNGEEITW